jgi:hypothetical protein
MLGVSPLLLLIKEVFINTLCKLCKKPYIPHITLEQLYLSSVNEMIDIIVSKKYILSVKSRHTGNYLKDNVYINKQSDGLYMTHMINSSPSSVEYLGTNPQKSIRGTYLTNINSAFLLEIYTSSYVYYISQIIGCQIPALKEGVI